MLSLRSVYSGRSGVRRAASVKPRFTGSPTEWLPDDGGFVPNVSGEQMAMWSAPSMVCSMATGLHEGPSGAGGAVSEANGASARAPASEEVTGRAIGVAGEPLEPHAASAAPKAAVARSARRRAFQGFMNFPSCGGTSTETTLSR